MDDEAYQRLKKLSQTFELARLLMTQHGLVEPGWAFRFNRARKKAGVCCYPDHGPGLIELSYHYVLYNEEADIRDTILHEIAHALAFIRHGHTGHGRPWKAVCLEIGVEPRRCYDPERVVMLKGKWRASCPRCGLTFHRHRRPLTQPGRHYYCQACGPDQGLLSWQPTTEINELVS